MDQGIYTNHDKVKGTTTVMLEYYVLPNYPIAKAKEDLSSAVEQKHLNDLKSEVLGSTQQARSTRLSGDTVGTKRKRVSSSSENEQLQTKLDDAIKRTQDLENLLIQEDALRDEYAKFEALKEKEEEYMKGGMKTMTGQFAGLNRFTLTDPEFHKRKENLHLAKKLWGITSYEFLQDLTEALYGVTPDKGRIEKMKRLVQLEKGNKTVHLNSYALTDYESCLMTLMWMENDAMDYGMLRCIWGVKDDKTLTDKIKVWSDIIGEAGEHLSILKIDKPFHAFEQRLVVVNLHDTFQN